MNEQFNMTLDLTPAQIKTAIVQFVNSNFTKDGMATTESDVTVDVTTHHEERGGMSYPRLKGATVKVKAIGSYQDR